MTETSENTTKLEKLVELNGAMCCAQWHWKTLSSSLSKYKASFGGNFVNSSGVSEDFIICSKIVFILIIFCKNVHFDMRSWWWYSRPFNAKLPKQGVSFQTL